jgi:hypothetical protein
VRPALLEIEHAGSHEQGRRNQQYPCSCRQHNANPLTLI